MLYYNSIDISKGIDPTKSIRGKECMICLYCFFNYGFKFQDSVFKGCHDLTFLSLLKMLIIVVLFITLANLKQLIY